MRKLATLPLICVCLQRFEVYVHICVCYNTIFSVDLVLLLCIKVSNSLACENLYICTYFTVEYAMAKVVLDWRYSDDGTTQRWRKVSGRGLLLAVYH